MHANFTEVVHGTRRRADDNARRRRGGIAAVLLLCVDEFAEPVRVLEGLVMYEPHGPAHQMGRADLLAPRVVVRVARGDLKVVVRGEGVDLDAVLDEQPGRPQVQYHGGDQRLLNLARLGTLKDADSWIDDSFSYIRELATFTFGSYDADKVEMFAANASNLPSSFGVDIRIGSSTSSLCAFAKIAAPALRRATNVQRYVLSTVGLAGQGSPWTTAAPGRARASASRTT